MQDLPAPGRIFGAVEVDTNHERVAAKEFGDWLEIQPGRISAQAPAGLAFDSRRPRTQTKRVGTTSRTI